MHSMKQSQYCTLILTQRRDQFNGIATHACVILNEQAYHGSGGMFGQVCAYSRHRGRDLADRIVDGLTVHLILFR